MKAVDDKQHHPNCDYKIGNYQERMSSVRMDGVFTEKQVNDAVRRISNDYMNPVQPKKKKVRTLIMKRKILVRERELVQQQLKQQLVVVSYMAMKGKTEFMAG